MSASELLPQLIETSLSVSLLIAVILVVRKPIARRFGAEAAYLLWLAPALRIVLPEIPAAPPFPNPALNAVGIDMSLATASEAGNAAPVLSIDFAPILLTIWAGGAISFLTLQVFRQRRFLARAIEGSAAPSARLAAEAATAARKAGLKKSVQMRVAATETGPLVCGLFDPKIVLPSTFETDYSPDERRLALAHEFAHVRRGDLVVALAAIVFRAAQWPNPLAHAAFARFRADQEAACDAAVLKDNGHLPDIAHAYGSAMLKSAASGVSTPAASLAMSHQLKERLMLMKVCAKTDSRRARILAAALVLLGVAASAGYSQAEERAEEQVVSTSSSVSVIKVDGGESIEYGGVKDAKKVEIRQENGVRTVKAYDGDGKLLSEKVYGAGEASPQIVIRDKDGKTRPLYLEITPPMSPVPPVAPPPPAAPDATKADCEARGGVFAESETSEGAGQRNVTRTCVISKATGDPKSTADALRAAIAQAESDPNIPAEHRAAVVAKLREQLAVAENETAVR